MKDKFFDQNELVKGIAQIADRLSDRGIEAQIYLVGGAAISLGYFDRRLTTDIDARVAPADRVIAVAEEIAKENEWQLDWFNNAASKLIPFMAGEGDWLRISVTGKVEVFVASAELLLAMKLEASRPNRDGEDIVGLVEHLGITSKSELEAIYEKFYIGEVMPRKAHQILSSIFGWPVN